MPISALDKQTANLLSTTQIITSVYSVVKELVENALDANAKNIEINLVDHGLTLIEVKDDGTGISKEDIPFVALPSYTSKISSFEDLEVLHSYGFRGEALNAVCNVANVTIITKTINDDVGSSYSLDSRGNIVKSEICHRSVGTTIQVKFLFKNIPIRRRIISHSKKINEDVKSLEWLLQGYGICRPSIRITYRVNNSILLVKPSLNSIEEALITAFGRKVICNMECIRSARDTVTINMVLPSKGEQEMSEIWQVGCQYIFVNNRPIKHKEIEKIIYKGLSKYFGQQLPSRRKVVFLVDISIDPADIDVNLDPNKTLVFFKNQNTIFDMMENNMKSYYGYDKLAEAEDELNLVAVAQPSECNADANQVIIEETEWPACKKRKLDATKAAIQVSKETQEDSNEQIGVEVNCNGKIENHAEQQILQKNVDVLNYLQPPILSDSDSNDTDDFIIVDKQNNINNTGKELNKTECKEMKRNIADETLSQLPVVDLGEEFDIENILNNSVEKNATDRNGDKGSTLGKKVTLESWSKGHIPGLKDKTEVSSFAGINIDEKKKHEVNGKLPPKDSGSTAFAIFSRNIRSQIVKENPTLTVPQIAQKISDLWKSLSPEERGYYRDLAREQKAIDKANKSMDGKGQLSEEDIQMNKKKFLSMLEQMKKQDKKESMALKTTTPWHINQTKVVEAFHNRFVHRTKPMTVVGCLPGNSNMWIVRNKSQLWLLNLQRIKDEFKSFNMNIDVVSPEGVQKLIEEWYTAKDDTSMMIPFFTLKQSKNQPY